MVVFDLVLDNALVDGSQVSIGIANGAIAAIEAELPGVAAERVDLEGLLVLPGLVEGHIHLDKSFLGGAWHPNRSGDTIPERIAIEREELAKAEPIEQRARWLLEQCIANGSIAIRSHVDIDPDIGFAHLEAILALREEYRGKVDIQIVAFPQHGVVVKPGTIELMETAIGMGAEIVGGLDPATFDGDVEGQLALIFGVAERTGVPLDIHLHDNGELGAFELRRIAVWTRKLGMQGRVVVSHAYALGQVGDGTFGRTAEALAEASIAIMTNAPGDHGFPPVLSLRAAAVEVFAGSDNVRDAWWPYGDADMLHRAEVIGYRSGFYSDEELRIGFDLVSAAGRRALGLPPVGLVVGSAADLIAVRARHIAEAVVTYPQRAYVWKAGRLVAQNGACLN